MQSNGEREVRCNKRKVAAERGQGHIEQLRCLLDAANWADGSSKPFAHLLCDNLNEILEGYMPSETQGNTNGVVNLPSGRKRQQRFNRNDQVSGAASSILTTNKKLTKEIIIKNKIHEDGREEELQIQPGEEDVKWLKYGRKDIQNETYQRKYYRCGEKGCPAKRHVQRTDMEHIKIVYAADHNCRHSWTWRMLLDDLNGDKIPPEAQLPMMN